MTVSVFQLFSIGIGPSSSHTVGPMRAARLFAQLLEGEKKIKEAYRIEVKLFGSLAMTGRGHATDLAILLGLEGNTPEGIDPNQVPFKVQKIRETRALSLLGKKSIRFVEDQDLLFYKGKRLPYHSNALHFLCYGENGKELLSRIYYSVGGGFIVAQEETRREALSNAHQLPYPFRTAEELLSQCKKASKTIDEIVMENEKVWRSSEEVERGIFRIWEIMQACVKRGCEQEGILPGGLNVKRRAAHIYRDLLKYGNLNKDPTEVMDWVSLFALAVNEENASGGRVVTAPTNGAAGVIPAVLHYYQKFCPSFGPKGVVRFFLTATAIGILYKEGASLSAAEMGCQGEVGVACSMAAAGLAAALGATNEQVENAAEIGMEHNLGLTCDPIGGLVQIPCIERNTMGAIKAINAARLAMRGDGNHRVFLDQVIAAMRHTGKDMKNKYKETSEGGLALHVSVSVPEC